MHLKSILKSSNVFIAILFILITSSTIYLTRIKWFTPFIPVPIEITPTAFWKAYQDHPDQYLFIDVRSKETYDTTHARGAINDPIGNLSDDQFYLPKSGKTIVLICTTGRLAAVAYGYLEHQGFLNVLHVQGGLRQWIEEGMPVEGTDLHAPLPSHD